MTGNKNYTDMKRLGIKYWLIASVLITFISCNDKRHPGKVYMPDMAYSRAYETYAPNNLDPATISYKSYPVAGTIRRGDLFPYPYSNDSAGYNQSASIKNPLPAPDSIQHAEAGRLFNIYCAICHGPNMDAQGPLAGKVGGIANLTAKKYVDLPEGTMYHSVTYGKNNMGSYASQLNRKQRWMVIQYIRSVQSKLKSDSTSAGTVKDSTAKKM